MSQGYVSRLKEWFETHLVGPLRQMSWTEQCLLISYGLWFGIFPVPGLSTTLLLFSFLLINRYLHDRFSVSETTVATAINMLSTPICIALMPWWMRLGSFLFALESQCRASQIIDELYVSFLSHSTSSLSNKDGFLQALSKFASCLGAATCSWLLASVVVLPAILIYRARIKRSTARSADRIYGEFTVLGGDGDSQSGTVEDGWQNGKSRSTRMPQSNYVRLGDSAELTTLTR